MTTPYDRYKDTKEWIVIEKAIQQLIRNGDIQLTTSIDYIIGYIAEQLLDKQNNDTNTNIGDH